MSIAILFIPFIIIINVVLEMPVTASGFIQLKICIFYFYHYSYFLNEKKQIFVGEMAEWLKALVC